MYSCMVMSVFCAGLRGASGSLHRRRPIPAVPGTCGVPLHPTDGRAALYAHSVPQLKYARDFLCWGGGVVVKVVTHHAQVQGFIPRCV